MARQRHEYPELLQAVWKAIPGGRQTKKGNIAPFASKWQALGVTDQEAAQLLAMLEGAQPTPGVSGTKWLAEAVDRLRQTPEQKPQTAVASQTIEEPEQPSQTAVASQTIEEPEQVVVAQASEHPPIDGQMMWRTDAPSAYAVQPTPEQEPQTVVASQTIEKPEQAETPRPTRRVGRPPKQEKRTAFTLHLKEENKRRAKMEAFRRGITASDLIDQLIEANCMEL